MLECDALAVEDVDNLKLTPFLHMIDQHLMMACTKGVERCISPDRPQPMNVQIRKGFAAVRNRHVLSERFKIL